MITKAIEKAFKKKEDKNWPCTYWAVDLHETVIEPNWSVEELPTTFYPLAKEVLQLLSKREDIILIMYTCSHPHEIEKYLVLFKGIDIHFNYVNENPMVINEKYGNYDKKPYFNVLIEDKAGFDPLEDWEKVLEMLKK